MINQQLLDYIKQQLQQGTSREQIKSSLIANDWQAQDIDEAFSSLVLPNQPLTPTDALSQSQSQPFSPQSPRRVKKTLLVIISIICCILIIGGGVFAYFNYFQSPESPEKIVQKMTTKLTEIKSLEYSGEIKAEVKNNLLWSTQPAQSRKSDNFLINFTGKSDIWELDDPKSLFSFNIKTNASPERELSFKLEIRTIGKIIYVKLSDEPNLGFSDLSAVKNQWIKIEKEVRGVERWMKGGSPEQIKKLKLVIQQAKIIKITEKLPSEKIERTDTYHYKFIIEKEKIKKLFTDISQIIQDKTLTERELAEFDWNFKAVEELSEGEIWIGKKDLLPYKVSLSLILKETAELKTSGKINFNLLLKNFNKPVQIDIPTQVKTLEEIMEKFAR